jgi:hypothetical protein
MPKRAQHIERPWLEELMAKYPGGRKAISEVLSIPLSLLSEYVTTDKMPRKKRARALSELLGFDLSRFYIDSVA